MAAASFFACRALSTNPFAALPPPQAKSWGYWRVQLTTQRPPPTHEHTVPSQLPLPCHDPECRRREDSVGSTRRGLLSLLNTEARLQHLQVNVVSTFCHILADKKPGLYGCLLFIEYFKDQLPLSIWIISNTRKQSVVLHCKEHADRRKKWQSVSSHWLLLL